MLSSSILVLNDYNAVGIMSQCVLYVFLNLLKRNMQFLFFFGAENYAHAIPLKHKIRFYCWEFLKYEDVGGWRRNQVRLCAQDDYFKDSYRDFF